MIGYIEDMMRKDGMTKRETKKQRWEWYLEGSEQARERMNKTLVSYKPSCCVCDFMSCLLNWRR